jgi:hypothetical protein
MKKFVAFAGIALACACAESPGPTGLDVQHTIDVPGNDLGTQGCTQIDLASCFAILDNQVKILYERSAWAVRRGEADYRTVSAANKNLSEIFQADTLSVPETLTSLDKFIGDVDAAIEGGSVSACWGDHLLTFGEWIRGKVAAGSVDVSDAPQMNCFVSPVSSVIVQASETKGVVLTLIDPWHYTGDPYGVYQTGTYFVVSGPNGTITTPTSFQTGPANVVIADPATHQAGTFPYSVTQCSDWGQCSLPFSFDVTIAPGSTGDPVCVQDNRDKNHAGPPQLPKCKKTK